MEDDRLDPISSATRPSVNASSALRSQTRIVSVIPERFGRRLKILTCITIDALILLGAAVLTAFIINRWPSSSAWGLITLMMLLRLGLLLRLGMYRTVLRYSGMHTLYACVISVGIGSIAALAAATVLGLHQTAGLGRQFWILEALLAIALLGGLRLSIRILLEHHSNSLCPQAKQQRVLVYGAGSLGELALRELRRVPGYRPVGFLDDNPQLRHGIIHGKRVYGGLDDLDLALEQSQANQIIVAMSDPPPELTRAIFRAGMQRGIHVLLAKGVSSAFDDQAGSRLGLRDLALEDLLKRPSRHLDERPVREMLSANCALVTGAGGSIGSDLCRQVARMGVRELHILDHSEFALYQIHSELSESFPRLHIVPHLLSLCDQKAVCAVFSQARPAVVFHAAAYKHVPLVEANPLPGLLNNVAACRNVIEAAEQQGCQQMVLISTDKAVRPTNVMGASKRVCELLMQAHASRPESRMRCCAVRFGNVLGSSGSVVPRFLAQIAAGGPVTVTDPDITRYFMLIPEAVSLVLQAAARSTRAGEIFILDMGEPVRIDDLARQLIFMHGKQPDVDIAVTYSGLRPGEKLYEELLIDDSNGHTDIPDITVANAISRDPQLIDQEVGLLLAACRDQDPETALSVLQRLVTEWTPSAEARALGKLTPATSLRVTTAAG